jgi:hypothetical protein
VQSERACSKSVSMWKSDRCNAVSQSVIVVQAVSADSCSEGSRSKQLEMKTAGT